MPAEMEGVIDGSHGTSEIHGVCEQANLPCQLTIQRLLQCDMAASWHLTKLSTSECIIRQQVRHSNAQPVHHETVVQSICITQQ